MKEKKKGGGNLVSNLILIVCAVVFCVSLWKLAGYLKEYQAGEQIYEDINAYVELPEDTKAEENTEGEEEKKPVEEQPPVVDSEKMLSINSDYVGWIYISDTKISYPIVRGVDNDKYLRTTFNGERNGCGSIFMDMTNADDFSDRHTILHGHNMKNGSMFGRLRNFSEKEYWEEHPYIWIVTPERALKYEIFACYRTTSTSDVYTTAFASDEEFQELLDFCDSKKAYDTGIRPDVTDRILTLSTCTSDTEDGRRIVHARLVKDDGEAENEE